MTTQWSTRTAERVRRLKSSAIREILKVTQQPNIISFAGGLPAPELFPTERIKWATVELMESTDAARALQYHPTEGYIPLREWVAQRMRERGIPCSVDNVLITSGSQQSIDLVGKVLIDQGDRVAVESPTFLGMIQAWDLYGARFDCVRTDEDGIVPDDLERSFRSGAKMLYMVPNFQNPTGVTTSPRRRKAIVELADHYGVPVIEDDPYGQLRYEGEHIPSVLAFDVRNLGFEHGEPSHGGNVLFLGSFSKELCPGIRISWVVGPTDIIQLLVQAKQSADLHSSSFGQMVVHRVIQGGFLDEHVENIKNVYRKRRDLMLRLMEAHFPKSMSWTQPEGGLFIWVRLPEHMVAAKLLQACIERNVAFVPGQPFFTDGTGHNTFRLNFSNAKPALIEEGIGRMAQVFRAHL